MTLRLYDHAASCNCYKVRLALAQLGIPYERVEVDIFDGATLTAEFATLNPARTTPVLVTPDGPLPESNAILAYLAEGTRLMPCDAFERAQVVRWLIYEQTDVIPGIGGLRFRLLAGRWQPGDEAALERRAIAEEVLALLEGHLAARTFLVGGRYSIADIAVYAYTHCAREALIDLEPYPSVRAWIARVEGQPGWFDDIAPYGANAAPGAGRSIYDG
jgi:glutathione S-transferase